MDNRRFVKMGQISIDIELPRSPNFLRTVNGHMIGVGELSQDEAKGIGDLIAEQFIEHAENKRKSRARG